MFHTVSLQGNGVKVKGPLTRHLRHGLRAVSESSCVFAFLIGSFCTAAPISVVFV